jgi:Tfp pilus assembly ATPase PilU
MTAEASKTARLLASMESWGASDLFVTEGKPPAARISGRLRNIDLPPATAAELDALLAELLTPTQRARLALLLDEGRVAMDAAGEGLAGQPVDAPPQREPHGLRVTVLARVSEDAARAQLLSDTLLHVRWHVRVGGDA